MPKIGEAHAIAADVSGCTGPGKHELPKLLPGRITYINREHRYFLVEAPIGGGVVIRECFKFESLKERSTHETMTRCWLRGGVKALTTR